MSAASDGRTVGTRSAPRPFGRFRLTIWQQNVLTSYLFILPFYVLFVVFVLLPFVWGLGLSLAEGGVLEPARYVGLRNYQRVLADFRVAIVLQNAVKYVLMIVPSSLVLGMLFALMINSRWTAWPGAFRAVVFFPLLASGAATAQIWGYILLPGAGILSYFLTLLGLPDVRWLTDPAAAPVAVALITVWHGVGFQTLVLSAALYGVPHEITEAARIDGAGAWGVFFRIKLPLIRPVVMFLVVIGTIGAFQIFDTVYVMTQGGPEYATQTIVGMIYGFAFQARESEGMAAALGVILFLIIMPISLVQMRALRGNVEY
ncbi:MAG TPA: sugar ABC transporter permease [Chloroflexota bacterium]|nr:sugar ABC transporter permease [Chloroflexota bacterium]